MRGALGSRTRRWLEAILQPIPEERRRLNAERHRGLPPGLQTTEQILGLGHHACGATHGVMERCDLACTSCYLGKTANASLPLAPEQVFRQLDELRAFLGPQGKTQITSGEVTLLPRAELGRYVRYARSIGLDPMVMTHGRRMLEEPEYLHDLMLEDGLEKISIHVDATQRGRSEWTPEIREEDLHPLRQRYAAMIREARKVTGRKLHAAHTVTVTERTREEIPSVMRWVLDHADAFRMVSFQPVAEVGRTQDRSSRSLDMDSIWTAICEGAGQRLHRHGMLFGHPECNILATLVVVASGDRRWLVEATRAGKRWDRRFLRRFMERFGGYSIRGKDRIANRLAIVSLALRNPVLLLEGLAYGLYRLLSMPGPVAGSVLGLLRFRLPRVYPLAIVVHKFMSSEELETPLGRERLAACTFRVPFEGRMIPMCEMNARDLRARLYPAVRHEERGPEATGRIHRQTGGRPPAVVQATGTER